MKKSVIEPANALNEKLFEIPAMVSLFAKNEGNVSNAWLLWLEEVEELLKKYNYPQCSEVAGYRATILSSQFGSSTQKRSQKRKVQFQSALSSVQPVQQLLSAKANELNEKIDQARSLLRQILIPAKEAGMINYDSSIDFTAYMESILEQFKQHEQIAPAVNNALATIGKYDILRILAEEIEFN